MRSVSLASRCFVTDWVLFASSSQRSLSTLVEAAATLSTRLSRRRTLCVSCLRGIEEAFDADLLVLRAGVQDV